MPTIFVTSSGTDVGKTYVSSMLVRQLRARGLPVRALKPVVSGFDEASFPASDTAALLAALGEPVAYENAEDVSRWRFRAALSPDMAAAREGQSID
ncbi:MAG TPA: AAA family ATPase, partial [Parvibaculum sp.]